MNNHSWVSDLHTWYEYMCISPAICWNHSSSWVLQHQVLRLLLVPPWPSLSTFLTLDCYIDHYCLFLWFVDHHIAWLVSHQLFISLDPKVPLDLSLVIHLIYFHLWRCLPFWLWGIQSIIGTDFSAHLVVAFCVCCACLHLTPYCEVLDCLRGIFALPAPGILSALLSVCASPSMKVPLPPLHLCVSAA